MVDIPIFTSSAEDDAMRVKRMMKESKPAETVCPCVNCEKRGVFACTGGCSWLLEESTTGLVKVF